MTNTPSDNLFWMEARVWILNRDLCGQFHKVPTLGRELAEAYEQYTPLMTRARFQDLTKAIIDLKYSRGT